MYQQESAIFRRPRRLISALPRPSDLGPAPEDLLDLPLRDTVSRDVINVVVIPEEG